METVESAANIGVDQTDTTVLVSPDGSIHMSMGSDWPLDSLLVHRGADSAFRVTYGTEGIRVEACDNRHTVRLESKPFPTVARALLGPPMHSS